MFTKKHLLVLASLVLAFGMLVGCSTDDTEPGVNNDIEAPVINPDTDADTGADADADADADVDADTDADADADADNEEDEDADTEKNNG